MEEIFIQLGMGALGGLFIAGAGYLKVIKTEAFELKKLFITLGIGVVSGAALFSGYFSYDVLLALLSMMGLTAIGQDTLKAVYAYFTTDRAGNKKTA